MGQIFANIGWMLLGSIVAISLIFWIKRKKASQGQPQISTLITNHFVPVSIDQLTISERRFPYRVRADLQKAIENIFSNWATIIHFCGVKQSYPHGGISLSSCLLPNNHNPVESVPPEYEEIDVGDEQPIRCLKNGIWFLTQSDTKIIVMFSAVESYNGPTAVQFQLAAINNPDGTKISQAFFQRLEEAVLRAECYRGKILSLEQAEADYSGESCGIKVHQLRTVNREDVILPRKTLDLLDRNVIQFVKQRSRLSQFRQATKKGLLFYGPPGTGKTHTLHYLTKALEKHTTLLISAEQVGLLEEYMALARLLQPSIVVLEDVDLIARNRTEMGACEEVLLNKLLNEMDGLKEEADILFILTTNRPEALEPALASRPGRIDQAIEFPLPDDEGREKLIHLYSQAIEVPEDVVQMIVQRTEKVSAAFIKELMRRSVQYHLEQNGTGHITLEDVEQALEEMLFSGGSLNLKLLGAEGVTQQD